MCTPVQVDAARRNDASGHGELEALLRRNASAVARRITIPRRWRSVLSRRDVMQEAYVDAWRTFEQYAHRDDRSFRSWLATLARNNLLDAIDMLEAQKRGAGRRAPDPPAGSDSMLALYELVGATTSTPSRLAARREWAIVAERAIRRLPAEHARAIRLHELEGVPVRDVAEALHRSEGATCMLLLRARRKLREMLGAASRFLSR